VKLLEPHGAIREDFGKLQQAAYAANFVEQVTETETPLPVIYGLVRDFLQILCGESPSAQTVFALELKLLRELGLEPDLATARLTPGAKKLLGRFLEPGWAGLSRLRLSDGQAGELRRFLHDFLVFHLGKPPRGRVAALAAGG